MITFAGIEDTPVSSHHSIQWIDVRVPSILNHQRPPDLETPPIDDASSVCTIRDTHKHKSPMYFLWRIHKCHPNVLEILQFDTLERFPSVGLRVTFTNDLCPFASICRNEVPSDEESPYMLYTMSVNGVVRLIYLRNVTDYRSGSVCYVEEVNTQSFHVHGTITSIAAIGGYFVIGKRDGWVGCFRLGSLGTATEGFMYELQEPWNNFIVHFVENMRRRTAAPVKDLLCLETRGRKLTFVLFEDGLLELWDLLRCSRFMHKFLEGTRFMRLWAGEINSESRLLPLAILHQATLKDTISIYRCHISRTWENYFFVEHSATRISKEMNSIIDVKLFLTQIWILRRDGMLLHNLSDLTESGECNFFGSLEPVVAEQLFETPEHALADLFWLTNSVFSFAKEQMFNCLSSIFMRILLLPGIYHKSVLRATFVDFERQITDSELHSLDPSRVREEIISILEYEEASRDPRSFIYCWKKFCSRYFHNWCHENAPCSLLLDLSNGAIGSIRKSSVSLLRPLRDTDILSYGSVHEIGKISMNLSSNLEQEVLLEVLGCTRRLSQHFGKAAPAIFYECCFNEPSRSPEDIVRRILMVLEVEYTSLVADSNVLERGLASHKMNTNFSTDMLVSLHDLYRRAVTWDTFVVVGLKYLTFLVSLKDQNGSDSRLVFESIFNLLLLLNYMLKISVQIHMSHEDVSKVQARLIRPIQQIIKDWNKPSELPALEDFVSDFSLLQTDSSTNQRPVDLGLRKRASKGASSASQ